VQDPKEGADSCWRAVEDMEKVLDRLEGILDRLTAVIQNTSAQERLLVRGAAAEVSSRESTEDLVEARWRTEVSFLPSLAGGTRVLRPQERRRNRLMLYDSKQRTGSSRSQGLATRVPTDPDPETKPRRGSDHQDQWDLLLEGRQQPDTSRGGQGSQASGPRKKKVGEFPLCGSTPALTGFLWRIGEGKQFTSKRAEWTT
jgi:hypothetical protein